MPWAVNTSECGTGIEGKCSLCKIHVPRNFSLAVNGSPVEEESVCETSLPASEGPTESAESKDPQKSNTQTPTQGDQCEETATTVAGPAAPQEKDGEEKKDKLKELGFYTLKVNLVLPGVAQPLEVTVSGGKGERGSQ